VEFVRENPGEPVPEETFTHTQQLAKQSKLPDLRKLTDAFLPYTMLNHTNMSAVTNYEHDLPPVFWFNNFYQHRVKITQRQHLESLHLKLY